MKFSKILRVIMLTLGILPASLLQGALFTTLNNNDPAPLYTTSYPYNYLNNYHKEFIKGHFKTPQQEWIAVDITPFYQSSSLGTDFNGNRAELGDLQGRWNMLAMLPYSTAYCPPQAAPPCPPGIPTQTIQNLNIDLPCGFGVVSATGQKEFPQCVTDIRDDLLIQISNAFLGQTTAISTYPEELHTLQGLLDLQQTTVVIPTVAGATTTDNNDPLLQNFGYFSVPIQYRKGGVRFNIETLLWRDIGILFCSGIASITQRATFVDKTTTTLNTNSYNQLRSNDPYIAISSETWGAITEIVERTVLARNQDIADAYGYCIRNFSKASIEDLNGEIFWRHAFPVNRHAKVIPTSSIHETWTKYLFIPFFALGGSIGTGAERDYLQKFGLPFGNNGSNAIRVRGGLAFDFYDTIELAGEVGFAHFSSRTIDRFPVANNKYQEGIFPFAPSVRWCPGDNFHAAISMNAYNFLSTVSCYVQYLFVSHGKDCFAINPVPGAPSADCILPCGPKIPTATITPVVCNPCAWFCQKQIERSNWQAQLINAALNVEISPNMRLGFAVQGAITGFNYYKASTVLGTFELGF